MCNDSSLLPLSRSTDLRSPGHTRRVFSTRYLRVVTRRAGRPTGPEPLRTAVPTAGTQGEGTSPVTVCSRTVVDRGGGRQGLVVSTSGPHHTSKSVPETGSLVTDLCPVTFKPGSREGQTQRTPRLRVSQTRRSTRVHGTPVPMDE